MRRRTSVAPHRRPAPVPGAGHVPQYHRPVPAPTGSPGDAGAPAGGGGSGAARPGTATGPRAGTGLQVVVADDHALLRAGTRQILEEAGDITVVGEAAAGDEALARCLELEPDVALLDIRMPVMNGVEVARRLAERCPSVAVVVLSAYDDDEYVRAALGCGVAGYLLKTTPAGELVQAVRSAAAGTTVLDPAISRRLAAGPEVAGDGLTWRERQVVLLVAEGLSNKAVASRLGISTRTVEGHLNHAFAKLGVASRTELVRRVLAGGIGSP